MNLAAFATVLGTLAVATGRTMDDETIDVYFAALQDVPFETFQRAVGHLVASETWFPAVGAIRAACDHVHGPRLHTFTVPALPPAHVREDDPRFWYACVTCQDSGWASHWCPGSVQADCPRLEMYVSVGPCGSSACARFGPKGYGHEFVRRCQCYATNPTIHERLEKQRTFAAAQEGRRR